MEHDYKCSKPSAIGEKILDARKTKRKCGGESSRKTLIGRPRSLKDDIIIDRRETVGEDRG